VAKLGSIAWDFVENSMTIKGSLVVFEGTPGAGKTSLVRWLASKTCVPVVPELDHHAEQSSHRRGANFAWYLRKERDRQPLLEKLLSVGNVVLQDRWYFSTLAFAFARAQLAARDSLYRRQRAVVKRIIERCPFHPQLVVRMVVDQSVGMRRRDAFKADARYSMWYDPQFLAAYEKFYETDLLTLAKCSIVELDSSSLGIAAVGEAALVNIRRTLGHDLSGSML
jgi:thymidylate kinase